ncbi:MAG TPA: hypothetical protein VHB21_17790, partial [Minicystis sp.]|nr:hypothetical protein [Minicystis sp.]
HRIGSPTDAARVEHDRPLECALCHADKSVAEIVGKMKAWYGKQFDEQALHALYGDDLGVNALEATLLRGKAHEQMAAAGALGERGKRAQARALLPLLESVYPLTRYYAKAALERLEGRAMPVDVNGAPDDIARDAARWLGASP